MQGIERMTEIKKGKNKPCCFFLSERRRDLEQKFGFLLSLCPLPAIASSVATAGLLPLRLERSPALAGQAPRTGSTLRSDGRETICHDFFRVFLLSRFRDWLF